MSSVPPSLWLLPDLGSLSLPLPLLSPSNPRDLAPRVIQPTWSNAILSLNPPATSPHLDTPRHSRDWPCLPPTLPRQAPGLPTAGPRASSSPGGLLQLCPLLRFTLATPPSWLFLALLVSVSARRPSSHTGAPAASQGAPPPAEDSPLISSCRSSCTPGHPVSSESTCSCPYRWLSGAT